MDPEAKRKAIKKIIKTIGEIRIWICMLDNRLAYYINANLSEWDHCVWCVGECPYI